MTRPAPIPPLMTGGPRRTEPQRRLCDLKNPAPYTNAANTDIRVTFARFMPRRELKESP